MRYRLLCCLALACLVSFPQWTAAAQSGERVPLAEYLETLIDQGVRIIYSDDLVTPEMVIVTPPAGEDMTDALRRLLAEFDLAIEDGPAGSILVVAAAAPTSPRPPPPVVEAPIPEIVVTSSLHRIDYAEPGAHTYIDAETATRIPVTGEEAARLTHRLPGTASGGISSRSHVRGGEENEVLFLFDGLRLYEPYHLRDFQSVATIVNSSAIGAIDFYTGAYPARFGDRMSGVMTMEMREPGETTETELSLSFFNTSVVSLGPLGENRSGDWLVAARRGNLDLVADVVDPDGGSPNYQDALLHLAHDVGTTSSISANILISNDKISLIDRGRGELARARYENRISWLKWDAQWNEALASRSILAASSVEDDRAGTLALPGIVAGSLDDHRKLSVFEFRQDWTWIPAERWMLSFGADIKHLDARYRHTSSRQIEPAFSGISGGQATRALDVDLTVDGAQYVAYSEVRWRASDKLTFDAGLRWDQQSYTTAGNDRQYSPRASFLFEPHPGTEIRLGWGQYYQAQETNELQITDGIAQFFPAQRAEHFVLNVRHRVGSRLLLEASAFRKSFRTLRPRFENLFSTLTLVPELQFDRIMLDPDKAEALGLEVTLTGATRDDRLLWWGSYAWAETRDWSDEGKIPRSWDQTHAIKAGISWQRRPWTVAAAADVHTGWPKTSLAGEMVAGPGGIPELVVTVSPRNEQRHATFASLDVRVSRDFSVKRGELTAFLTVTNLLDRANPCCTEYSIGQDGELLSRTSHWLPLVPSLGVIWRF